jgi:hypothetical protein
MKTGLVSFGRLCVLLALLWTLALSGLPPATAQARIDAAAPAPSADPSALIFIENAGQFAGDARFQVRGRDLTLWLAEDAMWLTVFSQSAAQSHTSPAPQSPWVQASPRSPGETVGSGDALTALAKDGVNIKLSFPGANPHPRIEPFNRLETHVSFFTGRDPAKWRADVPAWGGVRYVDLYPGIDLELTGEQGQLMPRLAARPGADLGAVRLRVEGADAAAVEGDALRLSSAGRAAYTLPLLRTKGSTAKAAVQPRSTMEFEVTAPFAPEDLDPPSAPVLNDGPADLLYGTFLGGSDYDYGYGFAVDGSGAAYVTGNTLSSDFPTTPGAFDSTFSGSWDAFVAKLNAAGSALDYATFLGGSGHDYGYGIAVDGSGAAYATGSTWSSDFPTTPGAFDTTHSGYEDAFVVKLNAGGSALAYATFLGNGPALGIAVDASGAAYVTGYTDSSYFPTTPGAFDTTYNGSSDAFVAKLNAAGSALDYATFLGGSSGDVGIGIAVDGSGAAYVTGYTYSSYFPTTPGAFDTTHSGYEDAFVVKLNAGGSALDYATFLGGNNYDGGSSIAADGSGAAYVTGQTSSSDFPTTPGAFDTTYNGSSDAFVAKLNAAGSALDYATFLGGSSGDAGSSIAVDGRGAAYMMGLTASDDFPTTPGAFDTTYNGSEYDAFVAKLNAAGSALDYATFLGGSSRDEGEGIAVDGSGAAYVTGSTFSDDFPTTPGAFDTSGNGHCDAFVVKLQLTFYFYLPVVIRSQ